MRDGDRSAGGDLFTEIRNDGPIAAQYVAETGGNELRTVFVLRVQFLEERLYVYLRDTLAGAHDIGGVYRLVGGDHHKALNAVFDRHVRHVLCSQNVSLNSLVREIFHQRHMLVSRRVIDYIRPHFAEDLLHADTISYIADNRDETFVREGVVQLQCEVMQRGLRHLEENRDLRVVFLHLAH